MACRQNDPAGGTQRTDSQKREEVEGTYSLHVILLAICYADCIDSQVWQVPNLGVAQSL